MIKEGVHCTSVGNFDGLGDYITQLRNAGKPVSIQSVDSTVGVFDAQHEGIHEQDGLMFRRTKVEGVEVDRLPVDTNTGLYTNNPEDMAQYHFDIIYRNLPSVQPNGEVELDFVNRVWTASINEPSRNLGDIEYLARYTLSIGKLFLGVGVKYLAYGWSTGTPEREFWEHPMTLEYLRLCEANPTKLGVSIHEYSLDRQDLATGYPYLVGRVGVLLDVCKLNNITYPYIHIGEFGWEERHADIDDAQLTWADEMYKELGINPSRCLWTLGEWAWTQDEIVADVIGALPMVTQRCVNSEDEPIVEPPLPTLPKIVIVKIPQEAGLDVWLETSEYAYSEYKRTQTASTDDMLSMLDKGNTESYAVIINENQPSQVEAKQALYDNGYSWIIKEI